jgi:hypothetical protein
VSEFRVQFSGKKPAAGDIQRKQRKSSQPRFTVAGLAEAGAIPAVPLQLATFNQQPSSDARSGGFLANFGGAKTNRHLFRPGAPRPTARGHESSSGRPQRAIIEKSAAYFCVVAPPKSARNPPHAGAAHSGQGPARPIVFKSLVSSPSSPLRSFATIASFALIFWLFSQKRNFNTIYACLSPGAGYSSFWRRVPCPPTYQAEGELTMKQAKWILISAIVALTVIAAVAQELEVLSVNALGYIKKTLPPGGKMICLNLPLDSMSEASNVFGRTSIAQELPNGSAVSFWNLDSQKWVTGTKSTKGVWTPVASNYVVKVGEGFFLKSPTNSVQPTSLTIAGEVPSAANSERVLLGQSRLDVVGNPYPTSFKFGESELAKNAANGSAVSFWNEDTQQWVSGTKSTKGVWTPTSSNYVVKATEGFFLKTSNATAWVWSSTKPYTWP